MQYSEALMNNKKTTAAQDPATLNKNRRQNEEDSGNTSISSGIDDQYCYGGIKDDDLMQSTGTIRLCYFLLPLFTKLHSNPDTLSSAVHEDPTSVGAIFTGSFHSNAGLAPDEQILSWYNVPPEPAQALSLLLKNMSAIGNPFIQMALENMTLSMRNKILEKDIMTNEIRSLKISVQQLQQLCKELQEANDQMGADNNTNLMLQVNDTEFEL